MAMHLKFTGLANFRRLLADDFKKWGVDAAEHLFKRDEVTKVEDKVGKALVANLPGEFTEAPKEEVKDTEPANPVEAAKTETIPPATPINEQAAAPAQAPEHPEGA